MKKIYVCMYLAKNLGDDLFLDTLVRRYPDCKFILNYISNTYDEFILNYDNLERCNDKRDFNKISAECHALIYMGGSIFQEVNSSKAIYRTRKIIIEQFLKRNKPVFILGSNFGPYKTTEFYNMYENLLKQVHDVCFRDMYSYELFSHLKQVRVANDIVFNSNYFRNFDRDEEESNEIGFSIINLTKRLELNMYHSEYIDSITKSIKLLIDKGYKCCLMSFCMLENDIGAIKEVIDKLPKQYLENIKVYEYKGNLKEAIELIAKFKLFIATRLHANIIGICLGVPILPIIYNLKISTMLSDLKLNNLMVSMDELNLIYDETIIQKSFSNKVIKEGMLDGSKHQFEKLDIFLNKENI